MFYVLLIVLIVDVITLFGDIFALMCGCGLMGMVLSSEYRFRWRSRVGGGGGGRGNHKPSFFFVVLLLEWLFCFF